jgi:hypothetical protein
VRLSLWCRTTPIRTALPQYAPKPIDKALLPDYGPGATQSLRSGKEDLSINGLGFATTPTMGQGGGRIDIGLLPGFVLPYALHGLHWDETRDAEDHAAVWPVHVRDEATGMPVSPIDQPVAALIPQHLGYTYGTHGTNPISGKTDCPYIPNSAHETHFGVVALLATGSDFDTEESAFWASWQSIWNSAYARQYQDAIVTEVMQTRGLAWSIARMAFAEKLLPGGYPWKAVAAKINDNSRAYYWDDRLAPGKPQHNIFGLYPCFAYPDTSGKTRGAGPWQEHYLTSALALQVKYGREDYRAWAQYSAGFALGCMTDLCYQMASYYVLNVCDPVKFTNRTDAEATNAELYTSWTPITKDTLLTAHSEDRKDYSDQASVPCGQKQLMYGSPGDLYGANGSPNSYPAYLQPALAAAVTLGLDGADAAWKLFLEKSGDIDYTSQNQFNIVPEVS